VLALLLVLSATPAKATVGVYVNQIASIDLKANTFSVDFWLWFRSQSYEVSPVDTFELVDGRIESKSSFIRKKLPNGEDYAAVRVSARIHQEWDLRRYPLDDHKLRIIIEDSEHDVATSVFVADAENQGIDPAVTVSGWSVGGLSATVDSHRYLTNFGDLSQNKQAETFYSRYVVGINVERGGVGRFFRVVFALLVSVMVSWCSFFLHPSVGARVSVPIGALFAAAAGSIAINSQLPDLQYLTVTDKSVFLSLGMIAVALAIAVLGLNWHNRGNEAAHKRVDRIGVYAFPIVYVLGLLLILK
jgi:hypothetical protein